MASRFPPFVGAVKKQKVHKPKKPFIPLTQRVQTFAFIIEVLLETLADLSERELEEFERILLRKSNMYGFWTDIPERVLEMPVVHDAVYFVIRRFGRESLQRSSVALFRLGRADLAQRLSDESEEQRKHLDDEHLSALTHKMATQEAVRELLLETLEDLGVFRDSWDFQKFTWFLQLTCFQKGLQQIPFSNFLQENAEIVELMVTMWGQQCVEVIREVLRDMNKTDLVQWLSESSSGFKEKHAEDERWPALIENVEMMTSVIELLLETLADLSSSDFEYFKLLLSQIHHHKSHSVIPWTRLTNADLQDTVFSVVQTYGQQSVKNTMNFLKKMNKHDLAQTLSDRSSEPKKKNPVDEGHSDPLIQKVATVAAVKHLLLETLNGLSNKELMDFKRFLPSAFPQKNRSGTSWRLRESDRPDIVDLLVDELGQKSVDVARKFFMDMNRTDLLQNLSETSSEKHSVDEHEEEALTAAKQILLETLNDLSQNESEIFVRFLPFTCFQKSLPQIQKDYDDTTEKLVVLMVELYGVQSVEVTREVLMDMKRTDLVQRLSDISSRSKGRKMLTENFLVETLNQLSQEDFNEFKSLMEVEKDLPLNLKSQLREANVEDIVELMVNTNGEECVEMIRKALMKINRNDLVQRLSEKHFPLLTQRVETLVSATELLLATLADLSDGELKNLKVIQWKKRDLVIGWSMLHMADLQDTVFIMVQSYGSQSVQKTMEVLKNMDRTDLAERMRGSSSEPKIKHLDEHLSAWIHKVATMVAVKELLLETQENLSYWDLKEFKWFLQFTLFQKGLPQIPQSQLERAERTKIVDQMMKTCGHQCVEVIREVFRDMNRTDLVQRLSESSSGVKAAGSSAEGSDVEKMRGEKHSMDECWPALNQKVEMMVFFTELLLDTLANLSYQELEDFKEVLIEMQGHKRCSDIQQMLHSARDLQDIVFITVQTYGQQSVQKTVEGLKKMNMSNLAQRLSDHNSRPTKEQTVDERRAALIHKVATVAAVKLLLLETLMKLNKKKLKKFKLFLQSGYPWNNLLYISEWLSQSDRADIVYLMVDKLGQQSVQVTRNILMDMNRTDLMQMLSGASSGSREKLSVDEHKAALLKREEAMAAVKQTLLNTLNDLSDTDLKKFWLLTQATCFMKDLPQIEMVFAMDSEYAGKVPRRRTNIGLSSLILGLSSLILSHHEPHELVDHMMDKLGLQSVEVTREVFMDMKRTDLVQRLIIGSKGQEASRSSVLKGCGGMRQDSSDWTKLEPEVNSTDADEAPTYSLQSEAGHFECSVSGLRWICKEKSSFQYQFSSWEGHMERMESRQYMPAGPLMDVKLAAGKLNEVHLPHWICIDNIPDLLDKFAVLHTDGDGDVVEKVSEVTASHVKLMEPSFSLIAALIRLIFPPRISCYMLIYYKPNMSFLKLHIYLTRQDPALKQKIDKEESSDGYRRMNKHDPNRYLQTEGDFSLRADIETAKIQPKELTFRPHRKNFYEVFIKNPDSDLNLTLVHTNKREEVWTCEIRADDYSGSAHDEGSHFVDKHKVKLIQKVSNVGPILDDLLKENVIQQECYDRIRAVPTSQEKMRELYSGPLKAGDASKEVFYKILQEHERALIDDLS